MKIKKFRYFMGDFETTVYKGQVHTEVWASAVVEFHTEDVEIHHSISETFEYLKNIEDNVCIYYHNLKFDGAFWLSYLLTELNYTQAYELISDGKGEDPFCVKWLHEKDMPNNSFKYSISNMGQWYSIIIRVNNKFIEIRDSLKLLPFSVKRIGNSFKTKHKKLDMEYTGFRYAGCEITDEEKHYIKNDVLVVKEALEIMFEEGHNKLTIGSCCLAEYKKLTVDYNAIFPDLYEIPLDKDKYGADNVGAYVRKSYKGGWCYVVEGKQNKIYKNGSTADVNSLYPSMMSSESGNKYPIGHPMFWKGDFIPEDIIDNPDIYYFIRIKTRFKIKENHLPFIQIKNNLLYEPTKCLETTDIYNYETNEWVSEYIDFDGSIKKTTVELTMTMTDYLLFIEHYDVADFEILDGCYFQSEIGLFDPYIEKYKAQKLNSKGARRELAKLFLNNLYGKMATNTNSSFKVAFVKEDMSIGFLTVEEHEKQGGYIPVGSAITSYARNFTIRARQQNYYGVNERGFIYADTDSIHCDLEPNEIKGITIHDKNFCCWKLESQWDIAIFTRQKTYIEHNIIADGEKLEEPYYNVKCAGMPEKCKDLFIKSMTGYTIKETDTFTEEEKQFITKPRTLENFTIGLKIPGKLRPVRIRGGVLLMDTTYEMR